MDSDINTDLNSTIFLMATMSPRVRDSIDMELYRGTADQDGSTHQYILEDAFVCFMNDLETIGLKFEVDYSDYCSNAGLLFPFLRMCSYILPNTLYELIRTDSKIRNLIADIVKGNLGDDETPIQIYISELGGLDGQSPLVPELSDYLDQVFHYVNQTDTFSNYFKNMIELNLSEKLMIESDEEAHKKYNSFLKNLIGDLSDEVNTHDDKPYFDSLSNIQNKIIKDLISPENFHDYYYLFIENKHTLPEDLHESHDRKWFYYKVSHPWNLEYYFIRKDTAPDEVYKAIIDCFNKAILKNTQFTNNDKVIQSFLTPYLKGKRP
jgi:hypothetical protein